MVPRPFRRQPEESYGALASLEDVGAFVQMTEIDIQVTREASYQYSSLLSKTVVMGHTLFPLDKEYIDFSSSPYRLNIRNHLVAEGHQELLFTGNAKLRRCGIYFTAHCHKTAPHSKIVKQPCLRKKFGLSSRLSWASVSRCSKRGSCRRGLYYARPTCVLKWKRLCACPA